MTALVLPHGVERQRRHVERDAVEEDGRSLAIASQRIRRITEDIPAAPPRGGRACIAARAASSAAGLNHARGARKVVRKAILEPDNNEIYAAYTLIRENLHTNDSGRTR